MSDEKQATVGRRDFLRKVGIGTVGAGATLATPLVGSAEADSESNDEKRRRATRNPTTSRPFTASTAIPPEGGCRAYQANTSAFRPPRFCRTLSGKSGRWP